MKLQRRTGRAFWTFSTVSVTTYFKLLTTLSELVTMAWPALTWHPANTTHSCSTRGIIASPNGRSSTDKSPPLITASRVGASTMMIHICSLNPLESKGKKKKTLGKQHYYQTLYYIKNNILFCFLFSATKLNHGVKHNIIQKHLKTEIRNRDLRRFALNRLKSIQTIQCLQIV